MLRACKVTTKFATEKKRRMIAAFLEAYRAAVNFYIKSIWNDRGGLDGKTLARLKDTRLSERAKSQALKQGLTVVVSTKQAARITGKKCSMPHFTGGANLDAKLVEVQAGRGSFDLVVRLSTLHKGHKIDIPTKRTEVLNKWTSKPLAKIVNGCELSEDGMILWVELPDLEPKTEGDVIGIDIGANKLIVDSNDVRYGADFKKYRDKVKRRKPGSKGKRRARIERDQYINRAVKQLPWEKLRVIGVEDLLNVKKGKPKDKNGRNKRSKGFRKAMAPWTYRRVLSRARDIAQENRVRLVAVPPAYTSRTCPRCGVESKENRRGENFLCVGCDYKADADHVGAQNVLARTLATIGSVESPVLT
jgi:hypothetical protein